ncbi:acyl-CoA dehydrogenase, N-terminal domain protein [Mycobacterium kansasii 732]|nr:acyl-CoA dehydrogenase, N-terminal domain protein [Mycobacterium kansasii 732]
MDLAFDEQTRALQAEVREFLSANKESIPTKSYDNAEGFAQHRHWDRVLFDAGLSVITWPKKYGGRDAPAAALGRVRGRILPRRSAGPGQRQRHVHAGAHPVRPWHSAAAGPDTAQNGQR